MLRALAASFAIAAATTPLPQWKDKHPQAAQALHDWVRKNPETAGTLFRWDGTQPDRTKALVDWALDHPRDDAIAFHTKHQDWPEFQQLLDKHRNALDDFLAWARRDPDATKDLMAHPRALEWVGKNLYPARTRQARTR